MKIFQFEKPIADAIRQEFINQMDESYPNSWKNNLFLSHEPSTGEVFSYTSVVNENGVRTDGVIAVYGETIEGEDSSSQTGEQTTFNVLNVDCYGFGDVIEKDNQIQRSSITAQKRSQVLTTIVYKAIMDAIQLVDKFGAETVIGEKIFSKIQKVGAIGSEQSDRTICFYRSQYRIKVEEDIPTEELGVEYVGGNADQETSNNE